MSAMASQITSLAIVYSTVYLGADQRNNQSSTPLAFLRGIHRWPLNCPHKWPVTRKMFPFDEVIMWIHVLPLATTVLESTCSTSNKVIRFNVLPLSLQLLELCYYRQQRYSSQCFIICKRSISISVLPVATEVLESRWYQRQQEYWNQPVTSGNRSIGIDL